MRHLSLFSGVGMLDLAVEALGAKTIATAEIDPWNRALLQKRFPTAHHFADVRDINERNLRGLGLAGIQDRPSPILISGGFPCQGISNAGLRKGLADERSGLWAEYARIIRTVKPDGILIENVSMLRSRGLERVLSDLYYAGYDAWWDCTPAAAAGAPHGRDRIWIQAVPRQEAFAPAETPLGTVTPHGVRYLKGGAMFKFPRAGAMFVGRVFERPTASRMRDAKEALKRGEPLHSTALSPQVGIYPELWPTPTARDYKDTGDLRGVPDKSLLPRRVFNIANGFWPTPRASANEWRTTKHSPSHGSTHGKTLAGEVNENERKRGKLIADPSGSAGNLNPTWVEWLMGLPLGWTDPTRDNGDLDPFPGWHQEPEGVPRTIPNPPNRKQQLMACGNGVVPQCAAIPLTELLGRLA